MHTFRRVLGLSCFIILCMYLYSDILSAVPRYLDVYHVISMVNMTLSQNNSETLHKATPRVSFKNDSFCRKQRPTPQKILQPTTSNSTIFSNSTVVNTTKPQKTADVNKTITPTNRSPNQSIYLTCSGLHKPARMNVTQNYGKFHTVNQQVFAFSAYYDHRPPKATIKIVTLSHVKHNDNHLLCQLWYEDDCEPDVRQVFHVDVHSHFKELARYCGLINFIFATRLP